MTIRSDNNNKVLLLFLKEETRTEVFRKKRSIKEIFGKVAVK